MASEKVNNGGFDSDASGWTLGTNSNSAGTLSSVAGGQSGNCLKIATTGATEVYARQTVTVVTGIEYDWSFYFKHGDGNYGRYYIGSTLDNNDYAYGSELGNASWTQYSGTFTATTTSCFIRLDAIVYVGVYELYDTVSVIEGTLAVSVHDCGETSDIVVGG